MSWTLLIGVVLALGLSLFASVSRRAELVRMARSVRDRRRAVRQGSEQAQLQHPVIDLSRCLGCGTCVAACPEDGVLELVHGQAVVVNGARCVGVSACERECPTGAVTVTIARLEERRDVPAVTEGLEAVGSPGLFLAGEVTAQALIKTAIDHGTQVAAEVARRTERPAADPSGVLDLCIVGAGPGGLACSLEARRHGLRFVTLDQADGPGGTVAKYPRAKLVMTQPMELPLYGVLRKTTFTKEELVDLWSRITVEQSLPMAYGEVFRAAERQEDGTYVVRTETGEYRARNVCLAIGRRGVPRKLGVPGEELPHVAYSLVDARSFQNRRILIVGGGDSAVEAALGLAEQPGNEVTISYRKEAFFRIRSKNEERLEEALARGRLQVLYRSEVQAVQPGAVTLSCADGARTVASSLPVDDVFVLAGGVPPVELLERSGVSCDPALRPAPRNVEPEATSDLTRSLLAAFMASVCVLLFALFHWDYYVATPGERAAHEKYDLLRPSQGLGLLFGISAVVLVAANLLYLVRRSPRFPFKLGSLRGWMTAHVATGVLALLFAMLHAGLAPRDSAGGHGLWTLAILLATGAIGRYFYAWVPRAANGRELELAEAKERLEELLEDWDKERRTFSREVRREVLESIEQRQWSGTFLGRVSSLILGQRRLSRTLALLTYRGRREGVSEDRIRETLRLARKAHRTALMTAHYEDLRAVLSTWRYLHRWVAVMMVMLLVVHVVYALSYGVTFDGGRP